MTFSFIVHEPKGVEYRTMYQMKATIFPHLLVLDTECSHVYETNCKIKSDFSTLIFCANTAHLLFYPGPSNFTGMYLTFISREDCFKFCILFYDKKRETFYIFSVLIFLDFIK